MPYTLTDEMIAELKEIRDLRVADQSGGCPFAGAASIKPCPVCDDPPNQPSKQPGRLADHLVCEVCQADGLNAADFGGCCHHGEWCGRCQPDEPSGVKP